MAVPTHPPVDNADGKIAEMKRRARASIESAREARELGFHPSYAAVELNSAAKCRANITEIKARA